ncbi:hypothetical protein I4U23_021643 [Adineta vaga]|nr:hypothetical protein I4U23_021643 [Adineta vaga]
MALAKKNDRLISNENAILFSASEQGDLKTLRVNLDSISSSEIPSIRDNQGATLAHYAARYGHINILEYLIENKHLDLSQLRTEHGATCAHDAAVCDQVQTLHYIFEYQKLNKRQNFSEKIHWTSRDGHGNNLLHLAAAYGSIRTLNYLIDHEAADAHVRSYNSFQSIHYAASSGHENCVKLLATAPDTVNEQTTALLTPMHLACQHGSLETVKILASHGGNYKLTNENGLNSLHIACQYAHLSIVQWMVEKLNATTDAVDYRNNTPLHYAAASGSEPILIYLLEREARITKSSDGNTPLHVAAENGHQGACDILIERAGCLITTRNNAQLTAIDSAKQYGYRELAYYLRHRDNPSLFPEKSSKNSKKIQLENATVVRLVVKKRNISRYDASNQVEENDLVSESDYHNTTSSSDKLINSRFDLSELRARVEKHDASRREISMNDNVLMHSMDSLNQLSGNRKRAKLPSQTYAPWLRNSNMTAQAFQEEIERVGSNLRKVGRDNIRETENANDKFSNRRSRQSQSLGAPVLLSEKTDQNRSWQRTGYVTHLSAMPTSISHQFISSSSQSTSSATGRPEWQRALINRRRGLTDETNSDS